MYDIDFYAKSWFIMASLIMPFIICSVAYSIFKTSSNKKKSINFSKILSMLKEGKEDGETINSIFDEFQYSCKTFNKKNIMNNMQAIEDIFYELSINKFIEIDNLTTFSKSFLDKLPQQKHIQDLISKGFNQRENKKLKRKNPFKGRQNEIRYKGI